MAMVLWQAFLQCSVRVSLLPCGPGCQPSCESLLIWCNCKSDWEMSSWDPPLGHACFDLLGWHLFCPLIWQSKCFHLAARMWWCWKIMFLRGLHFAPFKIMPVKLKVRHSCLRYHSQTTPIWVSFQDSAAMLRPVFICFKPFGWKESSCAAKMDLHVA